MLKEELEQFSLPDAPGVYLFRGARRKLLYVGKATSLKSRVRSYFSKDLIETRGPAIVKMVAEAKSVEYVETDSVLEALILEANLIKRYLPPYNTRDKDDKSFNYIVITGEEFPRVLAVRGKELEKKVAEVGATHLFGPYPHGLQFKEAMKIIRKLFPYFDTPFPIDSDMSDRQRKKLVFNQQIGVYPRELNKRAYRKTIKHLALFLSGKKKKLLAELEKEMNAYAKNEQFENAEALKRQIFVLSHIQDVSLIKNEFKEYGKAGSDYRIEAYDIAHTSGAEVVGVMAVVEGGEAKKSEYRKFKISRDVNNDVAGLTEVLLRRLGHSEWPFPKLIVVDGGKAQVHAAQAVLKQYGIGIPVVGVVKDERHRPREFQGNRALAREHERAVLLANSEAHRFAINWHRTRLRRRS